MTVSDNITCLQAHSLPSHHKIRPVPQFLDWLGGLALCLSQSSPFWGKETVQKTPKKLQFPWLHQDPAGSSSFFSEFWHFSCRAPKWSFALILLRLLLQASMSGVFSRKDLSYCLFPAWQRLKAGPTISTPSLGACKLSIHKFQPQSSWYRYRKRERRINLPNSI